MSVDLAKLPADEEWLRVYASNEPEYRAKAFRNVLDALNYFRCLALHREGEIERLRAAFLGQWNEDVGFTARDYGDLAKTIRMDADKPYLSAILSNNFNLILGALDAAAIAKAKDRS